jgi:hypothetical protein
MGSEPATPRSLPPVQLLFMVRALCRKPGTYTVKSDCSATFVVQTQFGALNLSGVIVGPSGKEIVQVSTDQVLTSDLKRF